MRARSLLSLLCGALALVGCVDDGPELTAVGEEGRQIAAGAGCMACHGEHGGGGSGPAWVGLAGSTVELQDGTTVVADREYLIESIIDPEAKKVATYLLAMPTNSLSEDEVDLIVTYLQELK